MKDEACRWLKNACVVKLVDCWLGCSYAHMLLGMVCVTNSEPPQLAGRTFTAATQGTAQGNMHH